MQLSLQILALVNLAVLCTAAGLNWWSSQVCIVKSFRVVFDTHAREIYIASCITSYPDFPPTETPAWGSPTAHCNYNNILVARFILVVESAQICLSSLKLMAKISCATSIRPSSRGVISLLCHRKTSNWSLGIFPTSLIKVHFVNIHQMGIDKVASWRSGKI